MKQSPRLGDITRRFRVKIRSKELGWIVIEKTFLLGLPRGMEYQPKRRYASVREFWYNLPAESLVLTIDPGEERSNFDIWYSFATDKYWCWNCQKLVEEEESHCVNCGLFIGRKLKSIKQKK